MVLLPCRRRCSCRGGMTHVLQMVCLGNGIPILCFVAHDRWVIEYILCWGDVIPILFFVTRGHWYYWIYFVMFDVNYYLTEYVTFYCPFYSWRPLQVPGLLGDGAPAQVLCVPLVDCFMNDRHEPQGPAVWGVMLVIWLIDWCTNRLRDDAPAVKKGTMLLPRRYDTAL